MTATEPSLLELDDIQHILLTRTPAVTGRYEFLSFDDPAGGRAWLTGLLDRVQSAADAHATMDASQRWITLAFTWNGLRALGVPEESLATFPDEFREGMAARADILGDTGANHPDNWVGGLAGDDLHAIAILFARTDAEHRRATAVHDEHVARCDGVRSLSVLDLNATPPFNYAHDHFGFRDRLSQPVMKGSGEEPTPGSGAALEPGRVHPRLSRRRRAARQSSSARGVVAQRQLHGLPAAARTRRRVSRLSARTRRHTRSSGAARREVHGPLAQRRPAGAGPGARRPRAGC